MKKITNEQKNILMNDIAPVLCAVIIPIFLLNAFQSIQNNLHENDKCYQTSIITSQIGQFDGTYDTICHEIKSQKDVIVNTSNAYNYKYYNVYQNNIIIQTNPLNADN